MTNQQFQPQLAPTNTGTPAQGFYLFDSLPKAIQDRLLYLQTTNGDFLRVAYGSSNILWPLVLCVAVSAFVLYVPITIGSGVNLQRLIALFAGSGVFLLWIAYSGWRVAQGFRLRLGNFTYLTQTQLIRTKNGHVYHRPITDVREIHFLTLRGRGGPTHVLTCRLNDNESFKFVFTLSAFSSKTVEANHWRRRAAQWHSEAMTALQRGDTAYFNSRNVFQGLSEATTQVEEKSAGIPAVALLIVATVALTAIAGVATTGINSKNAEAESWNDAVKGDNVTLYRVYAKQTRGKHSAEAKQKISSFYDEATNKIKNNPARPFDPKGVEVVLNLLENAQVKQDNDVRLKMSGAMTDKIEDDARRDISQQFEKMFPHETLRIQGKISGSIFAPTMELEVTNPIEPAPPRSQTRKSSTVTAATPSQRKFDFTCVISVPDKPKYEFALKSATVADFTSDLAKRFGLAAP